MRRVSLWIAVSAAFLTLACAGAPHSIDKEEISPEFGDRTFGDLLVVGAYDDRTFRVSSETAFVEELLGKGVTATASYASIPDLEALDNEAAIRDLLASNGHDGLLTVATIDAGYDYDYEDYLETRGLVYLLGGRPGAFTDMGSFLSWAGSGSYRLHLGLWDAETLRPVWQITTSSNTTGSESGDTRALADFVVETLRAKALLQAS